MKIINFSRRVFQNLTLKTIENSVKNGLAYKNRCKIRNICFLSSSLRHENYKISKQLFSPPTELYIKS